MKLIYHGQHGPSVTVGNPGAEHQVFMEAGVAADVPDDLGKRLLAEQPDTFTQPPKPEAPAKKES